MVARKPSSPRCVKRENNGQPQWPLLSLLPAGAILAAKVRFPSFYRVPSQVQRKSRPCSGRSGRSALLPFGPRECCAMREWPVS